MNLEALLAVDAGKLNPKQEKKVEIPRLSEAIGEPFIVTLRSIGSERWGEIQNQAIQVGRKGNTSVDLVKLNRMILLDGIVDPFLGDPQLLKHFGAVTPVELLDKLFSPGEMQMLTSAINELAGMGDEEVVTEVKN